MTTTETRTAIETLRAEATTAGDDAQVELCDRALAGDEEAARECQSAIDAAAAMADAAPSYTYSIFDADPNSSSGTVWPSHDDQPLDADDDDEAREAAQDLLDVEAAGLSTDDDYEVGDRIHMLVWTPDGTILCHLTHTLTEDDLA